MIDVTTLSGLSYKELGEIIVAAQSLQQTIKVETITGKRVQFEKELAEPGLSFADLVALPRKAARGPKKGGAVVPRYRDPANPENTWSGRGKPSKWLAALIAQGHDKEEFRIAA